MHGRETAVRGNAHGPVVRELSAGHERALDRERVVALAEEQVDDLDGRGVAVGLEVPIGVERDRSVAHATRVLARLAERELEAARERLGEVEVVGHVQTRDRGRRHLPDEVLRAAVGVDVERVDLLPLRRLRRDLE